MSVQLDTATIIGALSKERPSFLSPGFVDVLQAQARRYAALEKLRSRRQWFFGNLINGQWNCLPADVQEEVTRQGFYLECSYWINAAVEFPIVAASGETLRRWCEIAAAYENMPGVEIMREHLSFDHFRRARQLASKGKVSVPAFALATAAAEQLTAEEMTTRFDPPQAPDDYSRAVGWIDGLETSRFEWLPADKREQAYALLRQLREILG
jgi:hypothetical protein